MMISRRQFGTGLLLCAAAPVLAQQRRTVRLLVARQPAGTLATRCTAPCIRGSVYDVGDLTGPIAPTAVWLSGRTPICDVVERPWANNAPNVSAIPKGVYPGRVRTDATKRWMRETPSRAWRIELSNVSGGRSAIQFHYGLDEQWSEGCFIVGRHANVRREGSSTGPYCQITSGDEALAALREAVEAPGVDASRIEVTVADVNDLFAGGGTNC